jgi:hypothetical protein
MSSSCRDFLCRWALAKRQNLTAWLSMMALAACNGTTLVSSPPSGPHGSQTFAYTGVAQTFTVPTSVTRVTITAYGARGDGESGGSGPPGGLGAAVKATIAVKSGQSLIVLVGGKAKGSSGGFNGGGNGAYGGGGSSDVRSGRGTLSERIIVAGGGGGTGGLGFLYHSGSYTCPGGAGGKGGTKIGGSGGLGGCIAGGGGSGGSDRTGGFGGRGGPDGGPSLSMAARVVARAPLPAVAAVAAITVAEAAEAGVVAQIQPASAPAVEAVAVRLLSRSRQPTLSKRVAADHRETVG